MSTPAEVKALIAATLNLATSLPDDLDLRAAGLVDSLGFLRLIGELERRLSVSIDLSQLDPAQLTCVGALSAHVARHHHELKS
jgi:acyl carrier protein